MSITRATSRQKSSRHGVVKNESGAAGRAGSRLKGNVVSKKSAAARKLMQDHAKFFSPPSNPDSGFQFVTLIDYSIPSTTSTHS